MSPLPQEKKQRLLSRLHSDLTELHNNPYPGIEVFHHSDTNLHKLCLHLTPQSGAYTGLRLHFDVTLPENFPLSPPRIESNKGDIDHPNVFGTYICCDLLKEGTYYHSGSYRGGYTPAFTLRGLFIQFMSFFTARYIEQDYSTDSNSVRYDLYEDMGTPAYIFMHQVDKIAWRKPIQCVSRMVEEYSEQVKRKNREEYERDPRAERLLKEKKGLKIWVKGGAVDVGGLVKVEWLNLRAGNTLSSIKHYVCTHCGYGKQYPHQVKVTGAAEGSEVAMHQAEREGKQLERRSASQLPKKCALPLLTADILLYLATYHLPTPSIVSFGRAYPPFKNLAQQSHILLLRELQCFCLRTPLHRPRTILGIGIHYENDLTQKFGVGQGSLESTFDYLSEEAFENFNVREAVTGRKAFEFFLPLAFSEVHFRRIVTAPYASNRANVMPPVWVYLRALGNGIYGRDWLDRVGSVEEKMEKCLDPLWKMCNGMIVGLMREADERNGASGKGKTGETLLYASEKAAIGYLQIYHLLVMLMREYPNLRRRVVRQVKGFVDDEARRSKGPRGTKDLGEFLVKAGVLIGSRKNVPVEKKTEAVSPARTLQPPTKARATDRDGTWVTVARKNRRDHSQDAFSRPGRGSDPFDATVAIPWGTLSSPFLIEVLTRNVRWVLQAEPSLANLSVSSSRRIKSTFGASRTSLRLVMFQVYFLTKVAGSESMTQELIENYGFPLEERKLPEAIVNEIREIYKVDTYRKFFGRVESQAGIRWCQSEERLAEVLMDCIAESERKRYHRYGGQGGSRPTPATKPDPSLVVAHCWGGCPICSRG